MIPNRVYFFLLILLPARCRKGNNIKSYEIDENLLQRRCELICYLKTPEKCSIESCRRNIDSLSKPGQCPTIPNSILEEICLDDCKGNDYECPGTKKCCKQDCGFSCQDTMGLDADPNLPPIPFNITISERRRNGKMCEISWQIPENEFQRLSIFFVVETRSHVGSVFSQRKLGPWQWCNFHKIADVKSHNTSTRITVANIKLRMGLWYQIRIAALNEFGYRGYSNYSQEFRLTEQNRVAEPKPPNSPKNFTVSIAKNKKNNNFLATWIAPTKSDLPIDRYKIIWARYLNAENASLFLNYDYVEEPATFYELNNLAPNSVYYVQIQAISTNGRRKLKSAKESIFLNTTISKQEDSVPLDVKTGGFATSINNTEYEISGEPGLKSSIKSRQELHYRFVANKKYGMLVRVWSDFYKGSLLELCSGTTDCETKEYGAVRPRKDHIDFSKLKFNTEYTLRISDFNNMGKSEFKRTKTFVTPKCDQWILKFPNLGIACPLE